MTNEQVLMEIRNVIKQNNETKKNVNETLTHATNSIRTLEKKCSAEYERGLNDAWEAAKKIVLDLSDGGLHNIELHEAFDYYSNNVSYYSIVRDFSVNDVVQILRDYENKKNKKTETSAADEKNDYKIIAVDFDGTLCEDKWPEIGEPKIEVIDYLKTLGELGHKIILWTCRTGELLTQAVLWCNNNHGLYFDAVNQNLPEVIKQMGGDSRKIHADIYIDDKSLKDIHLDSIY